MMLHVPQRAGWRTLAREYHAPADGLMIISWRRRRSHLETDAGRRKSEKAIV
jgi:hypothetical protein